MRKERKLRRLDFDLIQAEMSVIDGELLRSIVGGYQDDCFWRCIAYIEGGDYSESGAESYADAYDPEAGRYFNGAGMKNPEMKEYINQMYTGSTQHNIIQYDPTKVPGMSTAGNTTTHVVVFKEDVKNSNGEVIAFKVYDPQQSKSYEIPFDSVMDILSIGNEKKNNGSLYGSSDSYGNSSSSDYADSSYHGNSSDYGSSSYYG